MKERCYITGAGEYADCWPPRRDDYIIAADAGYAELTARGITPDLVVGDFDSLGSAPEHPNTIRCPAEKDDTDIMLAVRYGLALGCKYFMINGGLGGILDHTLANIQVLAFISKEGARGVLLGRDICLTSVTDGSVAFIPGAAGRVSVFCAGGKAEGVTLIGLKYELYNAALTSDYPLGVSNEFTGAPAIIKVSSGTLIITWTGGPELVVD